MLKICSKCKKELDITLFSKYKRLNGGYRSACKKCRYKSDVEYKIKNKDKVLLYHRKYYQDNSDRLKNNQRIYSSENRCKIVEYQNERNKVGGIDRHKHIARKAIHNAVLRKKILKPSTCSICKKDIDIKLLHGHHNDYNKQLNVIWCCQLCHKKLHAKENLNVKMVRS